jgi:DNA-binding PadR family transcriptional regulator
MSVWDDRILEYLYQNEVGTSTQIAQHENICVSQPQISRRLNRLSEHNLIESLGNGVYRINEEGWHYLAGEYDAQKAEFVDPTGSGSAVQSLSPPTLWD